MSPVLSNDLLIYQQVADTEVSPDLLLIYTSYMIRYAHIYHFWSLTNAIQCIVLAIRPLLFSLLKLSLDHPRRVQSIAANSNSARTLLQICLESSQHIIVVLDKLREQDLLGESHLGEILTQSNLLQKLSFHLISKLPMPQV